MDNSDSAGAHFIISSPKSDAIYMMDKSIYRTPSVLRKAERNSETELSDSNTSDSEFSDSESSDLDPPYAKNWIHPLSIYYFYSSTAKVSWGPQHTKAKSDVEELARCLFCGQSQSAGSACTKCFDGFTSWCVNNVRLSNPNISNYYFVYTAARNICCGMLSGGFISEPTYIISPYWQGFRYGSNKTVVPDFTTSGDLFIAERILTEENCLPCLQTALLTAGINVCGEIQFECHKCPNDVCGNSDSDFGLGSTEGLCVDCEFAAHPGRFVGCMFCRRPQPSSHPCIQCFMGFRSYLMDDVLSITTVRDQDRFRQVLGMCNNLPLFIPCADLSYPFIERNEELMNKWPGFYAGGKSWVTPPMRFWLNGLLTQMASKKSWGIILLEAFASQGIRFYDEKQCGFD